MIQKSVQNRDAVIVITGPTASGKSATAMEVCRRLNGEIIGADSMQIYRGMDIGTAKPTKQDREEVTHHLIDILAPGEPFSVAAFAKEAAKVIRSIQTRGKVPVVCGGTGQYLSALISGIQFTSVPIDGQLRQELNEQADREGLESLYEQLATIDAQAAEKIQPTDRKRIVRALEIYRQTGMTKSEHDRRSRRRGSDFSFRSYVLTHERSKLYHRINQRVEAMMQNGLIEEVQNLCQQGVSQDSTCMQAIGYKELFGHLSGQASREEAVQAIQQATRRYAKRQLTWFRRMEDVIWLWDLSPQEAAERIVRDHLS